MGLLCNPDFKPIEFDGYQMQEVGHIHGANDRIVKPDPRATILVGGGHLISMTHSVEINSWLNRRL